MARVDVVTQMMFSTGNYEHKIDMGGNHFIKIYTNGVGRWVNQTVLSSRFNPNIHVDEKIGDTYPRNFEVKGEIVPIITIKPIGYREIKEITDKKGRTQYVAVWSDEERAQFTKDRWGI